MSMSITLEKSRRLRKEDETKRIQTSLMAALSGQSGDFTTALKRRTNSKKKLKKRGKKKRPEDGSYYLLGSTSLDTFDSLTEDHRLHEASSNDRQEETGLAWTIGGGGGANITRRVRPAPLARRPAWGGGRGKARRRAKMGKHSRLPPLPDQGPYSTTLPKLNWRAGERARAEKDGRRALVGAMSWKKRVDSLLAKYHY